MAKVKPLELQKYLQQINYPVNKERLITYAQQQGAEQEIVSALSKFPDKTFLTSSEVSQTLTGQ